MKFTTLMILIFLTFSYATFQQGDTLIYNDDTLLIPVYPLEENEEFIAKHKSYSSSFFSTANYRGYVATWEIENDTLFLVRLDAWATEFKTSKDTTKFYVLNNGDTLFNLFGSSHRRKLSLGDFFPNHNERKIPALWFNNTIILGRRWGESSNNEVRAQFEQSSTIVFEIVNGVVISVNKRDHQRQ